MNMIKRFCALALALLFTLTCFNFPARVSEAAGNITTYVHIPSQYVQARETFTVEIKATSDIVSLIGFTLYLEYDAAFFSALRTSPAASDALKALGSSTVQGNGGNTGSSGLLYTLTNPNNPVKVSAGETLFTVSMTVVSTVETTNGIPFTVSGSVTTREANSEGEMENIVTTVDCTPTTVNVMGTFSPEVEIEATNEFPQVGATLNAFVTNPDDAPGAVFQYRWFRKKEVAKTYISGATGTSYTATTADVGYIIGVEVRANGGGYTGPWVEAYYENTHIIKKYQTNVPGSNSIVIKDVSDTWIVLLENSAYEFAVTEAAAGEDPPEGSVWKKTNVFDRLTPNTDYYVWSRYAETSDTQAGPAYRYVGVNINIPGTGGIVHTTLTSHQIEFKTSGDHPVNKSSVYFTVEGGGPLVESAKVNIFAVPTEGYYFEKWECTYPGVSITGLDQASGAYFLMPNIDSKATITITAYFKEMARPELYVRESTTSTYAVDIGEPLTFFDVRLFNGAGEAKEPSAQYIKDHVTLYYKPFGEDSGGTTTLPTNVGKYSIIAVYKGDLKNHPDTHETGLYIIIQAPGAKPGAPVIEEVGDNFVSIKDTDSTLMYCIYPKNSYPPSVELSIWEPGNGGVLLFDGLYPATEYIVYVYRPATLNYAISELASTPVSTKHTWKATVLENNKACLGLSFFSNVPSTADIPAAKTITIRNDGNGNISNISVVLDNTAEFEITGPIKTSLAPPKDGNPGESTTFTIRPKAGLMNAGSPYEANITINAKQNEPDSQETKATDGDASVIPGLPKIIPVVYEISGDPPIEISGLRDNTEAVYNGEQQGLSGAAVLNPPAGFDAEQDLVYYYESRHDTSYPKSTQAPIDAGDYLVTVQAINGFAGRDTAILIINPAPLTLEGLIATTKIYDGTDKAVLTGGELKGVMPVDVSAVGLKDHATQVKLSDAGMPTVGRFNTPNHGTDIPVFIGETKGYALELTGSQAKNYTLTVAPIKGNIQAKPIMPVIGPVIKTYDNTYDLPPITSVTFGTGALVGGDVISVEFINCKTAKKDAGSNIDIIMGTMKVTGNTHGNYIISAPDMRYSATIEKKGVIVEVTGNAVVDYDGSPKPLKATYEACDGDTPNVDVLYRVLGTANDYSPAAPWLAGRYPIDVQINDPNYVQQGEIKGIRELVIQAAKLNYTNITRTVIPGDTALKSTNVSLFNVASNAGNTSIQGTYEIKSVMDADGILAQTPTLVGKEISYQLKGSLTADDYGKYAQVQVLFTPSSNTFEAVEMYLRVVLAEEGFTNTIINAPATVNIGEPIDLTNIRLHTEYDSGKPADDVVVTETMMVGYDRGNTSASGLGTKTVVVTFPGNPLRSASFNILVLDVIEGFTVKPPDKTEYYWLVESTIDVTGGLLMPTMRTKSPADAVPMLPGMLSVSNSTLLNLGEYAVNVTYQKMTKSAAFTIRVVSPPPISVEDPPSGSDPGVVEYDKDTKFTDTVTKKDVPIANVLLHINPTVTSDEAKLNAAMLKYDFFELVAPDCIQMLDISLRDSVTGNLVQPDKEITIRLKYPSGTTRSTDFGVLHVKAGSNESDFQKPMRRDEGLDIYVTSFSPFAIAWRDNSYTPDPGPSATPSGSPSATTTTTTTGTNPAATVTITISAGATSSASPTATATATPGPISSTQLSDDELRFWEAVYDMIKGAESGSVIRVNARNYDKVPSEIMDAMTKTTDTTLVISWDGGEDVVITSKTAFTPESSRAYFPMTLLADLFGTEPPKTDDPEEGEEWLREQRAAASASTRSGSSAQAVGAGSGVSPSAADTERFRAAVEQYLANAINNSNGHVYDISAAYDPDARMSITPATSGWLGAAGGAGEGYEGISRPQLGSPILGTPGLGALLIIVGVMLAIAGTATALFIARNRKAEAEEE